jgi:uncharacterized protein (DUF1778 family)
MTLDKAFSFTISIKPSAFEIVERAAKLMGVSANQFIRDAAIEKATQLEQSTTPAPAQDAQ